MVVPWWTLCTFSSEAANVSALSLSFSVWIGSVPSLLMTGVFLVPLDFTPVSRKNELQNSVLFLAPSSLSICSCQAYSLSVLIDSLTSLVRLLYIVMYSGSSLNLIASLLAFLLSLISSDVFSEIKKSCSFCYTDWQLLSRTQIIEVSRSSTAFSISSVVVRSPISIDFISLRNFSQFALFSLWTAFVRAFSTLWEFNLICTGRWSLPTSPFLCIQRLWCPSSRKQGQDLECFPHCCQHGSDRISQTHHWVLWGPAPQ